MELFCLTFTEKIDPITPMRVRPPARTYQYYFEIDSKLEDWKHAKQESVKKAAKAYRVLDKFIIESITITAEQMRDHTLLSLTSTRTPRQPEQTRILLQKSEIGDFYSTLWQLKQWELEQV